MQVKEQHYYSPEEYLELEKSVAFRSEYYKGQIFPIAGGSPNHNRIAVNLAGSLNSALKGQLYDVFIRDLRLWIPRKGLYTYPDVMVVSGQLEYIQGRRDTITNPLLLVEVLSKSTKNYDRGEKFESYRTLPSFQEYILIAQDKIYVEQYSKTAEKKWLLSEYEDINAVLTLSSIQFQISLLDIYNKVEFESEEL